MRELITKGTPVTDSAIKTAIQKGEWEGTSIPEPFKVRGTLDISGGKAVGRRVLGEAIPEAKRRLNEAAEKGEGTQQVNFNEGQTGVQSAK